MRYRRKVVRNDGVIFDSVDYAALSVNVGKSAIVNSIRRKGKCKGYTFQYHEPKINIDSGFIPNEIWKKHPYLDIQCSDKGRIIQYGRKLYGTTTSQGYKQTMINYKTYRINRLIAQTFIPNPENLPFVDHIDENKANNNLANLRWCTNQQNQIWYQENRRQ